MGVPGTLSVVFSRTSSAKLPFIPVTRLYKLAPTPVTRGAAAEVPPKTGDISQLRFKRFGQTSSQSEPFHIGFIPPSPVVSSTINPGASIFPHWGGEVVGVGHTILSMPKGVARFEGAEISTSVPDEL